jgi:hypothetical protein
MYQRLLWVLVADPLGPAVHTLGTTGLQQRPRDKILLNHNSTEYLRHRFERVFSLDPVSTESTDGSSRSRMWGYGLD